MVRWSAEAGTGGRREKEREREDGGGDDRRGDREVVDVNGENWRPGRAVCSILIESACKGSHSREQSGRAT